MRPRLAVITPLFAPGVKGGGPIRTLAALVQGAPAWLDLHVFTSSRDHGETDDMVPVTDRPSTWEGVETTYARAHTLPGLLALYGGLRRYAPDVLYLNSYWSLPFSQGVMAVRRCRMLGSSAVVIAPRGEFAPAALGRHSGRKRAMRLANRLLGTHRGVLWHASSPAEAEDIRRYVGTAAPVVVRENDSLLPPQAEPVTTETPASGRGALRAVFLGRLVEHKGPHLAAEAVAALGEEVSLDVFGPEEDAETVEAVRRAARASGGRVRFRGTVANEDVRTVLQGYDVLLMPTRSENFGHVIAEALSVAVPVVVPDVTPWSHAVRSEGAGRIVERDVDSLRSALTDLARLPAEEVREMRRGAARAYDVWRRSSHTTPHLFDLLRARGLLPTPTPAPAA